MLVESGGDSCAGERVCNMRRRSAGLLEPRSNDFLDEYFAFRRVCLCLVARWSFSRLQPTVVIAKNQIFGGGGGAGFPLVLNNSLLSIFFHMYASVPMRAHHIHSQTRDDKKIVGAPKGAFRRARSRISRRTCMRVRVIYNNGPCSMSRSFVTAGIMMKRHIRMIPAVAHHSHREVRASSHIVVGTPQPFRFEVPPPQNNLFLLRVRK